MSSGMISNKPVLKRLGTPADTDISTDLANIQTEVDKIGTPANSTVSQDIADTLTAVNAITGFVPYAKTVYIDANATGAGDGTSWTDAYTTYMAAFLVATNNTLFLIAPGEYTSGTSSNPTPLAASYCTVKAAQGLGTVTISDGNSSNANYLLRVSGSYCRIEDLKFIPKTYSSWGTKYAIHNTGSYNVFNNLTSSGTSEGRIFSTDKDKNILMNCMFELSGDTCSNAYGFIEFSANSDDNIIYNCHVKCTDTTQTKSIGFALGILSKRNMFINCSATNFFVGFSFSAKPGCTDNTILNCNFSNNTTDYALTNNNTSVGCNVSSKILSGNNPQDDAKAIYDLTGTVDGKADTISTAVVTDIPATLGTPTGADIATDLANIQTEVDKIGTPNGVSISNDINEVFIKEDEILRYTGFNGVNVWYVDSSIISSGDGKSWLSAFKTVQEAENARGAGDIISIRTGEYDENTNAEGLTITKDGGTFISTSQTYEGAVIVNSNASATGTVNISGNNNKFIGLSANGIDAWTITGTGNSFKTCSSSNSTNGFVIGELANNNLFDDIRLAMISASGFEINAAGNFIKNSYAAYCGTGFKFVSGATLCVIDNVASADSTVSGFEFESGSNMCYLINCSGKNTANIIDNSAGTSRIVNFREESLITSGISNQQETRLIHDKISTIKEVTLDLSQVAGTYDAITADGDILIEGYNVYVSTAGATFNYVSIQTDDTTPLVLLSSADGAVGNLTEGAQSFSSMVPIKFAGFRLSDGKKIQYTIDGSTGTGAIKLTIKYKQISSGAVLI